MAKLYSHHTDRRCATNYRKASQSPSILEPRSARYVCRTAIISTILRSLSANLSNLPHMMTCESSRVSPKCVLSLRHWAWYSARNWRQSLSLASTTISGRVQMTSPPLASSSINRLHDIIIWLLTCHTSQQTRLFIWLINRLINWLIDRIVTCRRSVTSSRVKTTKRFLIPTFKVNYHSFFRYLYFS